MVVFVSNKLVRVKGDEGKHGDFIGSLLTPLRFIGRCPWLRRQRSTEAGARGAQARPTTALDLKAIARV